MLGRLVHHHATVSKNLLGNLSPFVLSLAWACAPASGGEPASASNTPKGAPAHDPHAAAPLPLEPESTPATELSSVVAGPALDDLPPPPPAPLAQAPIDFGDLTELPRLIVDTQGHSARISEVLYTHDGRSLVTASYDKTIRVWSATTGELERTLFGEQGEGPAGRIHAAALSPGDRWLAVGGWLGTQAEPERSSAAAAFQIRVFDFRSETGYRLLSGHTDTVLSLAFSHDGKRLVSGGADGQALVWNVGGGHQELSLFDHHKGITSAAWSPDDRQIVTGSGDHVARVWDASNGRAVAQLHGHTAPVQAVLFTPSGRSVLSASLDGTVRIWDAQSGQQLKVLADLSVPIGSLSIAPSGLEVLVTLAAPPFAAIVYNINNGKKLAAYTGHDNVVLGSAISPNGKWAVTAGGSDFGISVFGLRDGKPQLYSRGHGQTVWNVGFARDGSSMAWGHEFAPGQLGQYQLNGPLHFKLELAGNTGPFAVTPVATDQRDFLRASERENGVELRTENGKEHEELQVWKAGRKQAVIVRSSTSGFVHRAFSASSDGSLVVSGGDNGVLASYATSDGALLRHFVGHTGDVLAVAISPDGKRVVSGSSDQTVRLWDMASGQLLLTVFRAKNGEWTAFTPAGYYAASAFGGGYTGFVAKRGPARPAAFFSAGSLSAQLQFDGVVRQHLELAGDMTAAISAYNASLPTGQSRVTYHRFADLPQFAPPYVYYLDPGGDLRVEADRLTVTARAHSPTSAPIESMVFLVDGRPLDERWMNHVGRPRVSLRGTEAEITATLPLPNAKNRISVVASNRYNQSEPVSFEVERKGGPKELEKLYQPDLYLLAIGISDYGSVGLPSLSFAHLDARAISQLFEKQNKSLFHRVQTRVLTEQNASAAAIRSSISWWASQASQKDLAVVFLSGYAKQGEDGNYYFMPHDADPRRLKDTGIALSDLKARLEALPARVLVLIDASHGGRLTESAPQATIDMASLLRQDFAPKNGVAVLTASTGTEASYESAQWKHGAFTMALLEGLGGHADYDRDRVVFVKELEHYLRRRVPQLTGNRQHPTTHIPTTLPNFPLSQR